MGSTGNTFQAVLNDFKTRLTAKELEPFQFAKLDDVRYCILWIQRE